MMAVADPRYEDGNFLVKITNDMLSQLHVPERVKHWSDINAHIFVTLFEGISGEPLRDVIRAPKTKEDEVHNVQSVIDTLSLDILHISLSHITGEDVVSGNKRAIGNLMEVVLGLLEFILADIGSDLSSHLSSEETPTDELIDDPDLVTGELIDEILEKELNNKCSLSQNKNDSGQSRALSARVEDTGNSTADLIALGRSSLNEASQLSANNTADLIALGDSRYAHQSPPQRDARQSPPRQHDPSGIFSHPSNTERESTQSLIQEADSIDRRQNGIDSSSCAPPTTVANRVPPYTGAQVATISPTKTVSTVTSGVTTPDSPARRSPHSPGSDLDPLGTRPRTVAAVDSRHSNSGLQGRDTYNSLIGGSGSILGSLTSSSGVNHASITHHLYHHFDHCSDRAGVNLPDFSSSLPLDSSAALSTSSKEQQHKPGRINGVSTVPCKSKSSGSRLTRTAPPATGRSGVMGLHSHSYDNLQNLMHDTVALSRAAVRTSPLRHQSGSLHSLDGRQSNTLPVSSHHSSSKGQHKTSRSGKAPGNTIKSQPDPLRSAFHRLDQETASLAAAANSQRASGFEPTPRTPSPTASARSKPTLSPKGIFSPSRAADRVDKAAKKVSFRVGKSSDESGASTSRRPAGQRPERVPSQTSTSSKNTYARHARTAPSKSTKANVTTSSSKKRQTITSPLRSPHPSPGSSKKGSSQGRSAVGSSRITHSSTRPSEVSCRAAMAALSNHRPRTFAEYLDKYYGYLDQRNQQLQSEEEEENEGPENRKDEGKSGGGSCQGNTSPQSDSMFELSDSSPTRTGEYSADADISEDPVDLDQLSRRQRATHPPKPRTASRLEQLLDDSAPGRMGGIRRKLGAEDKRTATKAKAIAKLYEMELEDFEEDVNDHMRKSRKATREKNEDYKKKVLRQPRTNKYKPTKKYHTSVLRPRVRTRSSSAQPRSRKLASTSGIAGRRGRKRSASASPAVGRRKPGSPVRVCDDDLLPWLLEEFPFLHLSKETLHELWRKSTHQIQQLTKAEQEVRSRKSKAQVQIEEAERRQSILMDLMKKELAHNQRLKEIKERQIAQQAVRTQLKNQRMQSARARRYYDEYQVRARSKMLKKRTKEELIFKRLFKEGLDIQRERIRELRQYAKEHREHRAKRQQDDLEAIENYYRDQFAMLTEDMNREREDIELTDKAQAKVVDQMKKELRQKMEREIRNFQEQLYRDEDEEYFRQLDADRLRHQLQLARYQASI